MIFSNCVYVSHADTVDKNITIIVDGTALSLDVAPVIVNGRVLLPLRSVFGAFNIEPQWDGNTKTVTANTPNMDMVLPIGSKVAFINGAVVELDVPAMIINGRTMVPVRFISEQLGATVVWDAYNYTVNITKSEAVSQIPTGETQTVITPPVVEVIAKEGKINIVSISPGENLIEGERVDLSVRVDYTFKGLSAAAIDISINNDMINESNVMLDKRYIAYESGSYTFNVNVLVEDIHNLGKLKINTCISEYSTGLAWNPMAKSEYNASIMKKVVTPMSELQSGIYAIKQAGSNLSLDVANYGNANGTNIQLANYVGNSAQKFRIEKIDGAYRIWSVCSPNLVVDIGGDDYSTRKHGTNIDLWKLNTDYTKTYWKDQEWSIFILSDGNYSIQPKHYANLALGINGNNIELKDLDESDVNQKWIIEKSSWNPRTVAPSKNDKNYYSSLNIFYPTYAPGAYDPEYQKVIEGNCTWYVCGRILELYSISGVGSRFGDASQWWQKNLNYYGTNIPKYKYGNTPKLGAIIVFNYGHVAIVEGINNNTITISESLFRGKNTDVLFKYRTLSSSEYGKITGYIYPNE